MHHRIGNIVVRCHTDSMSVVVEGVNKENLNSNTVFFMDDDFPHGRLDIELADVPAFIKTVYKVYQEAKKAKK